MNFEQIIDGYNHEDVCKFIFSRKETDVEKVLSSSYVDEEGFATLLSPAAKNYIEDMAITARDITVQRFGKTIKLYSPLYLSNECHNGCVYCGFKSTNNIPRLTLNHQEIIDSAKVIRSTGIEHVLLVTGEAPSQVSVDYIADAIKIAGENFSSVGVEIYPLDTKDYEKIVAAGADTLTIYQETFNKDTYSKVHPYGQKADFSYRLHAPERGAEAGFRTVGVGTLLGLYEPMIDNFFTGLQARYLMKKYWRTHITVSFPRIKYSEESKYMPEYDVSDADFVQILTAMRIFLPDVGIIVSTREGAEFRDNILSLGATVMSAGSKTEPGGYLMSNDGKQFEISDERTVQDFAQALKEKGFDPVMKDFDKGFLI